MFCFEELLLYRKSDIFYFSATRNQCNSETEMFYLKKFHFIESLIPSISLQHEINAMVKQNCFLKVYYIGTDTFYFYAARNQCNGETEMFCFEKGFTS